MGTLNFSIPMNLGWQSSFSLSFQPVEGSVVLGSTFSELNHFSAHLLECPGDGVGGDRKRIRELFNGLGAPSTDRIWLRMLEVWLVADSNTYRGESTSRPPISRDGEVEKLAGAGSAPARGPPSGMRNVTSR
jgi:hypothetical protein